MRSAQDREATSGTGGPAGGSASIVSGIADSGGDATPYATSAHKYLEAGWNPLPLLDQGKGRVPAGFTGYAAQTVTGTDISRWIDEQDLGSRGVCLRLMYEVGIDIDGYDDTKNAAEVWADLITEHGEPPRTIRVSSRFGADDYDGLSGIKLFRLPPEYRQHVEARIWKGQLGSGIDVIRLGHRQVVVWPTIHPKLGTRYQYLDERTGEIIDGPLPSVHTLPELPAVWVEAMLTPAATGDHSRGKGQERAIPRGGSQWWTEGEPCRAVKTALGQILRTLPDGRHDTTKTGLLKLTRLGEQGHEGVQRAVDLLCGAFVAAVEADRDEPALDEWGRMVEKLDGLIDEAGLTADYKRGCCPTGRDDIPPQHDAASANQNAEDDIGGRRIVLTKAADITPLPTTWLWDKRIPTGALTLIAGPEGSGKSTLAYSVAAQITCGTLAGVHHGTPRAVLVAATEDSWAHTIIPRLIAAGADLNLVYRIEVVTALGTGGYLTLPKHVPGLEEAAAQTGAVMLLLDPLMSRLEAGLDSHKDAETRRALEPIAAVAEGTRMTVVGLMHFNKSGAVDVLNNVMASKAFTAVARSVSTVIRDPNDDTGRTRIFGTPKNNLGPDDLPLLPFHLVEHTFNNDHGDKVVTSRVEWLAERHGTIADLMRQARDTGDQSIAAEVADWLADYLDTQGGLASRKDIIDAAGKQRFNEDQVKRGLKRLGLTYRSRGFPRTTYWMTSERAQDWDEEGPNRQSEGQLEHQSGESL